MKHPDRSLPLALSDDELTALAGAFSDAGFAVRVPAQGILQLTAPGQLLRRPRWLLSAGIHGDETAPLEMLAQLLDALADRPAALAVDLMIVVGNPAAIARGKRFIDADLNRMFGAGRGTLQETDEARRADAIMRACAAFFAGSAGSRWHLDLHAAIRPSRYPTFAVVPATAADAQQQALLGLLGAAGIEAAIVNTQPAATFSAYTAERFDTISATLELGQVSVLGSNDPDAFAATRAAIDRVLRSGRIPEGDAPALFRVARELLKRSEAFRFAYAGNAANFTPIPPHTLLAQDGDLAYCSGAEEEYLIFPNPDVRPGLRAGLTVVRER